MALVCFCTVFMLISVEQLILADKEEANTVTRPDVNSGFSAENISLATAGQLIVTFQKVIQEYNSLVTQDNPQLTRLKLVKLTSIRYKGTSTKFEGYYYKECVQNSVNIN